MNKKAIIVGAGFSGLSAACELANHGIEVTVFEKNEKAGGRASVFSEDGFTFDMGPSWYWMPDIFEWFFNNYKHNPSDFYDLVRLDPAYRVFFGKNDVLDVPADLGALETLFETIEPGSSHQLQKFLSDAEIKYKVGMKDFVFKPCLSIGEFAEWRVVKNLFQLKLFSSLEREVNKKFKNEKLRKLLKFPVYFLGALPSNTPSLYSILNYADLVLGTWYPMGGMYKIIEGMQKVAEERGVRFRFNTPVEQIVATGDRVSGVMTKEGFTTCDALIASADYNHVEQQLLNKTSRNYSEAYWNKKIFAPSCLIYYLGIKGKVNHLLHHNLFFDQSFDLFAKEIYTDPRWPSNPLFYVCVPSKTDPSVAPMEDENLFILIPVAPGLMDTPETRTTYLQVVLQRIESITGEQLNHRITYNRSFAPSDFIERYNAYKGNAYGLANTLMQTAILKPKLKNKELGNLYYAGQLTVPGPGMPPSIISGHIAAREVIQFLTSDK